MKTLLPLLFLLSAQSFAGDNSCTQGFTAVYQEPQNGVVVRPFANRLQLTMPARTQMVLNYNITNLSDPALNPVRPLREVNVFYKREYAAVYISKATAYAGHRSPWGTTFNLGPLGPKDEYGYERLQFDTDKITRSFSYGVGLVVQNNSTTGPLTIEISQVCAHFGDN